MNPLRPKKSIEENKKLLEGEFNQIVYQIGLHYLEGNKIDEAAEANASQLSKKVEEAKKLIAVGNKLMKKYAKGNGEPNAQVASTIKAEVAHTEATQ